MSDAQSVSSKPHVHRWQMVAHMDGCHWYATTYRCACGATREVWDERDVGYDGYSAIWMSREDGEEPCDRCDALMAGAKPGHRDEIHGVVA